MPRIHERYTHNAKFRNAQNGRNGISPYTHQFDSLPLEMGETSFRPTKIALIYDSGSEKEKAEEAEEKRQAGRGI